MTPSRIPATPAVLTALALAAAIAWSAPARAEPAAAPVPKVGACPSGYSTSGNYCAPGSSARFALPKVGACPRGYSTSGSYCLAGANARHALPKSGSCPSGYSTSGDYCLSSR
jgi:hypothetical protein